jgi:hypothetical protein
MTPHPDFAGLDVPEALPLGPYVLTMLTGADVVADFTAVTGSAAVLRGLFAPGWPDDLTFDDDLTDLHWHHREFTARRSFAWIIRDGAGAYLGCAYLFPDIATTRRGEAVFWFTDTPDRLSHIAAFGPLYHDWWAGRLPQGYDLRLSHNARLGR